jgi:hypothetical protein
MPKSTRGTATRRVCALSIIAILSPDNMPNNTQALAGSYTVTNCGQP